jgi:hypothetical protein
MGNLAETGVARTAAAQTGSGFKLPRRPQVNFVVAWSVRMASVSWWSKRLTLAPIVGVFLLFIGCGDSSSNKKKTQEKNLRPSDPGYNEAARKAINENRDDLPHLFPKK